MRRISPASSFTPKREAGPAHVDHVAARFGERHGACVGPALAGAIALGEVERGEHLARRFARRPQSRRKRVTRGVGEIVEDLLTALGGEPTRSSGSWISTRAANGS